MPSQFRELTLPSLTGVFDAQSTPDSVGYGNYRLRKNWSRRGATKTCRRGGWVRHEADTVPYNNQDLHDQLLGQQYYYQSFESFFFNPGGVCDYAYPYFWPTTSTEGTSELLFGETPVCGYYPEFPYPNESIPDGCFAERVNVGFPYVISFPFYGACNLGPPYYYAGNYFYLDCATQTPGETTPGYGYGAQTPIYCDPMAYTDQYCGTYLYNWLGCREAVTMLHEVNGSAGRRLLAATMSRVYEYNHGTGDWVILADSMGNASFTTGQCGCNDVRFTAASMGDYTVLVNGFNEPLLRQMGGLHTGCNIWAANPIDDLRVIDLQSAGGVVAWKGFMFLFDVVLSAKRQGGTIVWSDFENPLSWIPSDSSLAGQSVVAVGETFLAAAPLGNFLYLYSDRSVWRVTLVGGDQLFSFDQLYTGTSALKFKYSLVNTGNEHIYLGGDKIYIMTQFDQRPIVVDWIDKAGHAIYFGMNEEDATFQPINKNKCNQVVGGWNEEFKEVWFSWPTGNNLCPDWSMVLNMQYPQADLVDAGFTSFLSMRPDLKPTVAEWLVDQQICMFSELLSEMIKEGQPCTTSSSFNDPPLYLVNPTEDADLPVHPDSLCAALSGKTEEDFCRDCGAETKYLMAAADDFTIKEYRDDIYYRELYQELYGATYCAVGCDDAYYFCLGYDNVLQSGAQDFRSDEEKLIKRLTFEVDPVAQTTPSNLQCWVGYSSQAVCDTWVKLEDVPMKCLDPRTPRQLEDQILRDDKRLHFQTYYRGKYISWKIKVSGTSGGSCFGNMVQVVRGAEGNYSR